MTEATKELNIRSAGEMIIPSFGDSTPARLLEVAINKDLDIVKLEKLMVMQERWEQGQARRAYYMALAKFESLCPVIPKNKTVSFPHKDGRGFTEYSYATLDQIIKYIKEPLEASGLSFRWMQDDTEAFIKVTCTITHAFGHHESATLQGPLDASGKKNVIQQRASTISYLRRYTLTGLLGIASADTDDDGQSAPDQTPPPPPATYSEDSFRTHFPSWQQAVLSGKKTPADIIATVESKAPLTDEQKQQINNIGAAAA